MANKELVYPRIPVHFSSSIANFEEKVGDRFNYPRDYTLKIGLYHWADYLKFIFTRGKIRVLWCGSDIKNLNRFWAFIIRQKKAEHICENWIEEAALMIKGIFPKIQPVILTDPDKYPANFHPSVKPHVFINCHAGREEEYGIDLIEMIAHKVPEVTFHVYGIPRPFHQFWFDSQYGQMHNYAYVNNDNIIYHGKVPEDIFDSQIKHYQAGLCLNKFSGFSEVLAKSILLGQYPISRIKYPDINSFETEEELIALLNKLKDRKASNPYRETWYRKLRQRI